MPDREGERPDLSSVADRIAALPGADRRLIAVAGPPAVGKSTFAEALVGRLLARGEPAVLVPMDGFHLDNAILDARDLRHRKGAPETFDVAGFVHAMRRLDAGGEVILPAFDRRLDLAVAGRIAVRPEDRIAVVEGNYLCLDEPPWRDLGPLWDLCVFLDAPEPVLERRLVERWLSHGFAEPEARRKASENDLPNARRVLASRIERPDLVRIPTAD